MTARIDDAWNKSGATQAHSITKDYRTIKAINSGSVDIKAGAPCIPDGWDATKNILKLKKPTGSDEVDIVLFNLGADVSAGSVFDAQPGTGRVLRREYDTSGDVLDDYGAKADEDTLIKDETGFKLIADIGGGVGLFLPFRQAGGGLIDFSEHLDKWRINDPVGTSIPTDFTGDTTFETYMNLNSKLSLKSGSSISLPLSITAEVPSALDPATEWNIKIFYFDTAFDLSTITDWNTRPLGTQLPGQAIFEYADNPFPVPDDYSFQAAGISTLTSSIDIATLRITVTQSDTTNLSGSANKLLYVG